MTPVHGASAFVTLQVAMPDDVVATSGIKEMLCILLKNHEVDHQPEWKRLPKK